MEFVPLTPDQQEVLQAGGELAEQLLTLRRDGPPEGHDPLAVSLTPPACSELERQRTEAGFTGCVAAVDVFGTAQPELWMVGIQAADQPAQPFGDLYPHSFRDKMYEPFRQLPVSYVGYVDNTVAGTRLDDQVRVYHVEQPDDPDVHHGGIVVGLHMIALGKEDGIPAGSTLYETASLTQKRILANANDHEPSGDGPGAVVAKHLYESIAPPKMLSADEIRACGAVITTLADRGHILG